MPNPDGTRITLPVAAGTSHLRTGPEGGDLALDSDDSRELKFNQSGTIRTLATLTGTQTLTNKTLTSPVITGVSTQPTGLSLTARTPDIDIDNGAGTTADFVVMRLPFAVTITAIRVVYTDATTGTVAAATAQVGTTAGGTQIVAATALENSKAIGTTTAMTIVSGAVAANTPVIVRHTGVGATQAGKYFVEYEYDRD